MLSWITWIGFTLLTGSLWLIGSRLLRIKRTQVRLIAVLVIAGTWVGLNIFRETARTSTVTTIINSPRSGEQVEGYRIQVRGTVTPSSARVILIVRSEKDTRWWMQKSAETTAVNGDIGQWQTDVWLGTPTEGASLNYQIIAVSSADSPVFNLFTGRLIVEEKPYNHIPDWQQSKPKVVRRTK